ncbi:MAG: aminopeptidase P family N-terminal domain-containing protein, partial [Muribaculaceae bacterium]|nr:aminopeptidase P family N-terminal domain-containing protein [Muribaculaceae bacterium]
MSRSDIAVRIDALRAEMTAAGVSAVIVPHTDYHLSEYIADHWQARRFLSGFTGSAGTLVVTLDETLLWTDSRYFLQAGEQLDGTGIILMKEGLVETPSIAGYLVQHLDKGAIVGVDGMLMSIDATYELRRELEEAGLKLDVTFDVLDKIWSGRPAIPSEKVFVHEEKYAGETAESKIAAVLGNAAKQGASSVFVSALDEIAWILNIRSRDVESNPVATSFLYLSAEGGVLFISKDKVGADVKNYLADNHVAVMPYDGVRDFLDRLPADSRVLLSSSQTAGAIEQILGKRAVKGQSAAAMLKAVKNPVQIEGVRNAMLRDGVAMVESLKEIEETVASGGHL